MSSKKLSGAQQKIAEEHIDRLILEGTCKKFGITAKEDVEAMRSFFQDTDIKLIPKEGGGAYIVTTDKRTGKPFDLSKIINATKRAGDRKRAKEGKCK